MQRNTAPHLLNHTTDRVRRHLKAQKKASFLRDRTRQTPSLPHLTATLRPGVPARHRTRADCLQKYLSSGKYDDKPSVVCAKAPMRCVGRQARKLRMSEMKQRLMIAGFHIDLRLCLDAIVDDSP